MKIDLRVLRVLCVAFFGLIAGCKAPLPEKQLVPITTQLGSWQGRDNATLGFVSDSGRFQIKWEARNENPKGSGRLHIVVHSAVSGRPLQDVLTQKGDGSGTIDFNDDPRSYNLMVESVNVDWSIAVDGTSGVYVKK